MFTNLAIERGPTFYDSIDSTLTQISARYHQAIQEADLLPAVLCLRVSLQVVLPSGNLT